MRILFFLMLTVTISLGNPILPARFDFSGDADMPVQTQFIQRENVLTLLRNVPESVSGDVLYYRNKPHSTYLIVKGVKKSALKNIGAFAYPDGMNLQQAMKCRFYKEANLNKEQDEVSVYFGATALYCERPMLWFKKPNGEWESLRRKDITVTEKKYPLVVEGTPDDAIIQITHPGGKREELLRQEFPEGNYRINIIKSGYVSLDTVLFIPATKMLSYNLKERMVSLKVNAISSNTKRLTTAEVYIDGKYKGETPLTVEVSPFAHNITVKKDGCTTVDTTVNLKREVEKTLNITVPEISKTEIYKSANTSLNEKDYKKAMQLYLQCVDSGDSYAMVAVGNLYFNGLGIDTNYVEAKKWYKRAAELGEVTSNLGYLYHYGLGGDTNYVEAMKWYKKASDLGSNTALYNIGHLYMEGLGVDIDYMKALKSFLKACDNEALDGISLAYTLWSLYYDLSKDEKLESSYHEMIKNKANSGSRTAISVLAENYYGGFGYSINYKIADSLYRLSASLGCPIGKDYLQSSSKLRKLPTNPLNSQYGQKRVSSLIQVEIDSTISEDDTCPDILYFDPSFNCNKTYNYDTTQKIINSFLIDSTEVIQGEYQRLMGVNPSTRKSFYRPVTNVNWYDAILYCNERSKENERDTVYSYTELVGTKGVGCSLKDVQINDSGNGYRLPTSSEYKYLQKHSLEDSAISPLSSYEQVAISKPNTLGIYDIGGNVNEWCNNHDSIPYDTSKVLNTDMLKLERFVFYNGKYFWGTNPSSLNRDIGFRCVLKVK